METVAPLARCPPVAELPRRVPDCRALQNHSCVPNVRVEYGAGSNVAFVVANRDIEVRGGARRSPSVAVAAPVHTALPASVRCDAACHTRTVLGLQRASWRGVV